MARARQAVFRAVGDPVELIHHDLGEIEPGKVRIEAEAVGVAMADLQVLAGTYPYMPAPGTPLGYDLVGRVTALGTGVPHLVVGQRAGALMTHLGAYADQVDVPADYAVPVPEEVDAAEATSLFLNYLTAEQMLHHLAGTEPGARILVNSAAGGVGGALLDLARRDGIVAVGSTSTAKLGDVANRGAEPFDYRTRSYDELPRDFDAVFDAVGGPAIAPMYRRLRSGGAYVSYGFLHVSDRGRGWWGFLAATPTIGALLLRALVPDGRRVRMNMGLPQYVDANMVWYRRTMRRLLHDLASGSVAPRIAARVPLAQATEAHALLASGTTRGKVVLVP